MTVPIRRARINCLVESAPISKRAKSIKIMVKELLRDLTIVSVIAWFMLSDSSALVLVSSLILSNTTIVSCTEKDRVVRTAVTNKRSTWTA